MKTVKIYSETEKTSVKCLNPECGKSVSGDNWPARYFVPATAISIDYYNGKHFDKCEWCDAPFSMQRVYDQGQGGMYLGIKYKLLGLPVEQYY